jgi:hypothetical protein
MSDLSGCYYQLGDNDNALQLTAQIDPATLTEGEQRLNDWRKALIYFQRHHYREAAPTFRLMAAWPGFKYRSDAQRLLIDSLAGLDEEEEVIAALREYVAHFHASDRDLELLSKSINPAYRDMVDKARVHQSSQPATRTAAYE